MFAMMTPLMICDIRLLYMCKVITCLCVCFNFCMPVLEALQPGPVLEALQPGPGRLIKKVKKLKKLLCSSVMFLG
jgi:hypothetical protein